MAYKPSASYLYLPDGWNSVWEAAKAARASTPAWLTVIGDSIAEGVGTSDPMSKTFVELARTSLLGGATPYADFYPAYGTSAITLVTGTPPWSAILNSVVTSTDSFDGWTRCTHCSSGSTAVAHQQFTLPYACTSIDICYMDKFSGTWQYKVGAAANVTVTNTTAITGSRNAGMVKKVNIAGPLTAGTVIQYGWGSSAGVAEILGITCYAAAVGLGFARIVADNKQMQDYSDSNSTVPYGRADLFGGPTQSAGVQGGIPPAQPPQFAPGAALVTAAGNIDAGSHLWAYTNVGVAGESGLSAATGALTTDGTHGQVTVSSIAVGNAAFNVTDRNIYRTKAGTTTPFFKVGSVGNNTGTTFSDNVADASLGAQPPAGPGAQTVTWGNFGFPMNPHLAIIALGVNDQNSNQTQANYELAANRIVAGLRRGRPHCSILFIAMMYPDMESSDLNLYLNNPATYSTLLVNGLYNVARNMRCGLLNIHAKWQNAPKTNGFISGTAGIHPGDTGHQDIANSLLSIL